MSTCAIAEIFDKKSWQTRLNFWSWDYIKCSSFNLQIWENSFTVEWNPPSSSTEWYHLVSFPSRLLVTIPISQGLSAVLSRTTLKSACHYSFLSFFNNLSADETVTLFVDILQHKRISFFSLITKNKFAFTKIMRKQKIQFLS